MRRQTSQLVFVVLNLLCVSSAYSGGWLSPEDEAILKRSSLRCLSQEHSRVGYEQSGETLELAYQHHLDDLTLRLTAGDIADSPKEVEQQILYISCRWFKPGKPPQPPG
jgi:hypothetical protein